MENKLICINETCNVHRVALIIRDEDGQEQEIATYYVNSATALYSGPWIWEDDDE